MFRVLVQVDRRQKSSPRAPWKSELESHEVSVGACRVKGQGKDEDQGMGENQEHAQGPGRARSMREGQGIGKGQGMSEGHGVRKGQGPDAP